MKISLLTPESQNVEPWVPVFQKFGVEVQKNSISSDCDFLLATGQAELDRWRYFHSLFPHIPMINYTWDFYGWVYEDKRGWYDWHGYSEYMQKCVELWCPSNVVIKRLIEHHDESIAEKCTVIKTWARFFDADGIEPKHGDYILGPLRMPFDPNLGWLEKVCKKHDIPLFSSKHKLSERDFHKAILHCRFMASELYEASTGGLTLLEGLQHGKVSLVSNSPYMGASEYLQEHGYYFQHDDFEDFEAKILDLWNSDKVKNVDLEKVKKYCDDHPTIEDMVQTMIARMKNLKGTS